MAAPRVILDSGAVIALSRGDARVRGEMAAARAAGVDVCVPAVVLAETVRGSATDAPVDRVVKTVSQVADCDERTGRLAGRLLGEARSTAAVDALVVATAIRLGGGVILTGDPDDLGALAANHPEVVIRAL